MPPESETPGARRDALLLGLVLLVAALLSISGARHDSTTADEPWHLVAGIAQARTGTWLLSAENAPLAKHLFGAAAVAAGERDTPRASFRRYHEAVHDFLFRRAGAPDPARTLFAARLVTVAFLLASGMAVFFAAGRGPGGLLATALLFGNGALFAHGHLATLDVPFCLFAALFAAALVRFLDTPDLAGGALLTAALAGALATKGTGLALLAAAPLAALVAAAREAGKRSRLLAGAVLAPLLALGLLSLYVHLAYLAHEPPGVLGTLERIYGLGEGDRALVTRVAALDGALARYLFGVLVLLRLPESGQTVVWMGKAVARPPAAYHLAALALKSSLPWLAAVGLGAAAAIRKGSARRATVLFGSALFVLAVSLPGPRIGVRHVFPVVVLASAAAGAALGPLLATRARLLAALLVALAPLAWGRSLGHLNALARLAPQPPLADSNVDWGQDLVRLRDALARRGIPPGEVDVAYFGGDDPAYRIPGARDLARASGPPRRWLAVSKELLLIGADAALFGDRALLAAGLAAPRGRRAFTVGDSIEVYERRTP